ncbi:MAG: 23S rRNA (pseudouridine(1915)-N(3))-methyltransferase RlmH [Candidatus Saccharimonadales bacterium]
MKLHLITIGKPKLEYARLGFNEYTSRLGHYHNLRVTHLNDKFTDNSAKILEAAGQSYKVVLEITGQQLTSPELAKFLQKREIEAREVCFIIGGPDGLPQEVIDIADYQLSFGKLTLPHDLAMVVLAETLYRASTINAGIPYHK